MNGGETVMEARWTRISTSGAARKMPRGETGGNSCQLLNPWRTRLRLLLGFDSRELMLIGWFTICVTLDTTDPAGATFRGDAQAIHDRVPTVRTLNAQRK
ncbi:hypothetical protein FKP32DRAFT_1588219 [Trametes sanguinea]|nr:hypothetical protein FKP32DRAFT_1588219 [Trametes sanguinea]